MVRKKVVKCFKCGEASSEIIEEKEFKHAEKIGKILKSSKTPHEKKMALFNWLKDLDVGELETQEKQRVNSLLLSELYAELAKEKKTAEFLIKKNKND